MSTVKLVTMTPTARITVMACTTTIVAREDRGDQETAQPGAEDQRRHHRAADQPADIHAQEIDRGDQGIAEDMVEEDHMARQALGPGGADIVRLAVGDQAGAQIAGEDRRRRQGDGEGRQEQMVQPVEKPSP